MKSKKLKEEVAGLARLHHISGIKSCMSWDGFNMVLDRFRFASTSILAKVRKLWESWKALPKDIWNRFLLGNPLRTTIITISNFETSISGCPKIQFFSGGSRISLYCHLYQNPSSRPLEALWSPSRAGRDAPPSRRRGAGAPVRRFEAPVSDPL